MDILHVIEHTRIFFLKKTLIIHSYYIYVISIIIHFRIYSFQSNGIYKLTVSRQNEAKIQTLYFYLQSCQVSDTSLFFLHIQNMQSVLSTIIFFLLVSAGTSHYSGPNNYLSCCQYFIIVRLLICILLYKNSCPLYFVPTLLS